MTAELRQQRLADGDVLVHLRSPSSALLLGASLCSLGIRDLLLGGCVHLSVGGVSLLILLLSDEYLTLPFKFLFWCFPVASGTAPLSSRSLKRDPSVKIQNKI